MGTRSVSERFFEAFWVAEIVPQPLLATLQIRLDRRLQTQWNLLADLRLTRTDTIPASTLTPVPTVVNAGGAEDPDRHYLTTPPGALTMQLVLVGEWLPHTRREKGERAILGEAAGRDQGLVEAVPAEGPVPFFH